MSVTTKFEKIPLVYLCGFVPFDSFTILLYIIEWLRITDQMLWNLLLTGFSKIAKLLYSSLDDFCDILWLGDRRLSATSSAWVVVEFLRQLVTKWLHNLPLHLVMFDS